jgi:hypothetical protein
MLLTFDEIPNVLEICNMKFRIHRKEVLYGATIQTTSSVKLSRRAFCRVSEATDEVVCIVAPYRTSFLCILNFMLHISSTFGISSKVNSIFLNHQSSHTSVSGQTNSIYESTFLKFGKFDQSDRRFSSETRGNQSICNCLVFLV